MRRPTIPAKERSLLRIASIGLFFGGLVLGCTGTSPLRVPSDAPATAARSNEAGTDVQALLDSLKTEDPDCIGVDNSSVYIRGRAIDAVVAAGPKMLRPLCARMKVPSISFDAFVRYYAAANQIIVAATGAETYWTGGATTQVKNGRWILTPGWQDPETMDDFRRRVWADIEEKAVLMNAGDTRTGFRTSETNDGTALERTEGDVDH